MVEYPAGWEPMKDRTYRSAYKKVDHRGRIEVRMYQIRPLVWRFDPLWSSRPGMTLTGLPCNVAMLAWDFAEGGDG